MQALDLLRDLNAGGKRTLPEHVPTGFVKPALAALCASFLAAWIVTSMNCAHSRELRDRLRAGDIWVTGSR